MDIRLLATFVAVADEGTATGGARVVNYSVARVSQHVRMLEESLGARLFERGGRGMQLTPAGNTILPVARVVIHAVAQIEGCSRGGVSSWVPGCALEAEANHVLEFPNGAGPSG